MQYIPFALIKIKFDVNLGLFKLGKIFVVFITEVW